MVGFARVEASPQGASASATSDVRALGGSFGFPSAGLALTTGQYIAGGPLAWSPGSFLATVVYLFVFAPEMGLAEKLQPEIGGGGDPKARDQREPDGGV